MKKASGERPVSHVPRAILAALLVALGLQCLTHWVQIRPHAQAKDLHAPPPSSTLALFAFGNPTALARLLMLDLQSADTQPGLSLSLADLDYPLVETWLARILELDPRSQYPLLFAVRVYGGTSDEAKARMMFDFAYRQFLLDPNRRWRWLAEACISLKHRLNDSWAALAYARALREKCRGPDVPSWAKQMEIFILEDMDEIESAKVLLGGLIASGQVNDSNELRFLATVMERLKKRSQ